MATKMRIAKDSSNHLQKGDGIATIMLVINPSFVGRHAGVLLGKVSSQNLEMPAS
jgi:hypothetical protein